MAFLISSVPFFRCYVRKEYTRNLEDGHGEFLGGEAYGIRCVRGHSLMFQVGLDNGAAFKLPIEALCWQPCEQAQSIDDIQPWDCGSETHGVTVFDFLARGAMLILPRKVRAQYRWSVDFTGSDLADDPKQGKCLHVAFLEDGTIGAFPNNRVLWVDPAFRDVSNEKPDFKSLSHEFRAEGFQELFSPHKTDTKAVTAHSMGPKPLPNGHHTNPEDRPDWQ